MKRIPLDQAGEFIATTGDQFIIEDVNLDAVYQNPAWDNINGDNAMRTSGKEDLEYLDGGMFKIYLRLPPAYGAEYFYGTQGTSRYDICTVQVRLKDKSDEIVWNDIIYHKAYYSSY